jgi:hypothetical protein
MARLQKGLEMITNPKAQKIRVKKWLAGAGGEIPTISALDKIAGPVVAGILERAAMAADEDPLLVSDGGGEGWFLLTTKRPDTIEGKPGQPQTWNRYNYAAGPACSL